MNDDNVNARLAYLRSDVLHCTQRIRSLNETITSSNNIDEVLGAVRKALVQQNVRSKALRKLMQFAKTHGIPEGDIDPQRELF